MRITEIRDISIPISRYRDPQVPSGGLTTSVVTVHTDIVRDNKPVVGYGYASVGRYGQSGLIRERFGPRLLAASDVDLADDRGEYIDPFRAWRLMMAGEKPGGHGERCVAVGALDMALWDAAAKTVGRPLRQLLTERLGSNPEAGTVRCYASGGYPFPRDDLRALAGELREMRDLGFTHAKIKIGQRPLSRDVQRIDTAVSALGGSRHLAVDAMNSYDSDEAMAAAAALTPYDLWWLEDVCDPLDFATQSAVAGEYHPPIAAGEALFSVSEAVLLDQYAGLRRHSDVLVFDPVHCYGLPGYLDIIHALRSAGWPPSAFWPHGGHLFSLHIAAALGLGGVEMTPFAFHPFHGPPQILMTSDGQLGVPDLPGIGFELHDPAWQLFRSVAGE